MARLQWQNVAAPDFSSSLQGIETFSRLLNRATTGAQETFKGFEDRAKQTQQEELARRLSGFQDNTQLQEALKSGSIFQGLNRLGAQDIMLADNRQNTLLDRQGSQLGITEKQGRIRDQDYTFGRTSARDAARDAAAPVMAAIRQAEFDGKPEVAAKLRQDNASILGGLDFNDQKGALDTVRDDRSATLRWSGEAQNQQITGREAGWRLEDRNLDGNVASVLALNAQRGGTAEDLQAMPEFQALDGRGQLAALTRAGGVTAPSAGGGAVAGSPLGDVGDGSRVMNYKARAAGFSSVPDSVKTLGDASDFALQVNRAGVDSSAMGTYQIVGQTLRGKNNQNGYAERVFGSNWRSVPWNLENQDKVAEAIFNDNKGSAESLRNQWVSLTPAEAERVRKLPWAQARDVIAQGETSVIPSQVLGRVQDQAQANVTTGQITDNSIPIRRSLAAADPALSYPQALTTAISQNGPLAGMDRDRAGRLISRVMRDEKVNASAAVAIVANSLRGETAADVVARWTSKGLSGVGAIAPPLALASRFFGGTDSAGDGMVFDRGMARVNADTARNAGNLADLQNAERQRIEGNSQVAAAAQQVQQLQQIVQQMKINDQNRNITNNPATAARERELIRAQQILAQYAATEDRR